MFREKTPLTSGRVSIAAATTWSRCISFLTISTLTDISGPSGTLLLGHLSFRGHRPVRELLLSTHFCCKQGESGSHVRRHSDEGCACHETLWMPGAISERERRHRSPSALVAWLSKPSGRECWRRCECLRFEKLPRRTRASSRQYRCFRSAAFLLPPDAPSSRADRRDPCQLAPANLRYQSYSSRSCSRDRWPGTGPGLEAARHLPLG
ncbi:hypothetical protein GGR56DRAFT_344163 [Xylariaceae sp. FL0804]|nr:hypothetical protein GGR56DRAFT_344163 [Xylariaceae sp. FL0804]